MINKKNILCFCHTYYQLLVAIQLRLTKFSNDDMYLIMSDHSKNAKTVVDKLKKENIFSHIFYAEIKPINKMKKNPISVFRAVARCISDMHKSYDFAKHLPSIDLFLFYNDGYLTCVLYYGLIKKILV